MNVKGKVLWNSVVSIGRSQQALKNSGTLRFASSEDHLRGIPRRVVITTVGMLAKLWTSMLNRTTVHNMNTLRDLVYSRPPGTPLLTVTNHMSTLDDPLMWGLRGLPLTDSRLCRWVLAAEDICFKNPIFSYFFRLGKCIPIRRGAGIYQPYMNEALDVINGGDWLHTFPEGKLSQEVGPLRRLKWGVASLIARANVQPIVLPIAHSGFEKFFLPSFSQRTMSDGTPLIQSLWTYLSGHLRQVLPENYLYGKRPPLPLCMKRISIVVGEPMVFDIPQLKLSAKAMTANSSRNSPLVHPVSSSTASRVGSSGLSDQSGKHVSFPVDCAHRVPQEGLQEDPSVCLDDCALSWMYSHMSENMRSALQELVYKARSINKADS